MTTYIAQAEVDVQWNDPLVKSEDYKLCPFSVVNTYRKGENGKPYATGTKGFAGGFFGCCGIGILSHCHTADNLKKMHSIMSEKWSCLMYTVAEYQIELTSCLEQLGYKRVNEFHNDNSGNTVYIYCWNKG